MTRLTATSAFISPSPPYRRRPRSPPPENGIWARALGEGKTSSGAGPDGYNLQLRQSLIIPPDAANILLEVEGRSASARGSSATGKEAARLSLRKATGYQAIVAIFDRRCARLAIGRVSSSRRS